MNATVVATAMMLLSISGVAGAQVQVRVGVPGRATYSELHEALRNGSPAADSVKTILRAKAPGPLWRQLGRTVEGKGDWNSALLSLTRLAELRSEAYADSAARMLRVLESGGSVPFPSDPGLKAEDLEPSLQAIVLERRREVEGDSAVLADVLSRIPSRKYNHGDAWVLGRLCAGALDSVMSRFRSADTEEFRVRYLTLLSYFTDPRIVPLLVRGLRCSRQLWHSETICHPSLGWPAVGGNQGGSDGTHASTITGSGTKDLRRLQPGAGWV